MRTVQKGKAVLWEDSEHKSDVSADADNRQIKIKRMK